MNNFDYKRHATFVLHEEENTYNHRHTYDDGVPWSAILDDFITFLEAAGYSGVRKRVSIEDSPFVDERWQGPVHGGDDWK